MTRNVQCYLIDHLIYGLRENKVRCLFCDLTRIYSLRMESENSFPHLKPEVETTKPSNVLL